MSKSTAAQWMILLIILLLSACTRNRFPDLVVAEEAMVSNCQYLATISEISDPGKFVTDYHFARFYDGELKVLERAENMKSTHIVWLYNHPIGSSASAYRCVQ
jgi:hypothetical protein